MRTKHGNSNGPRKYRSMFKIELDNIQWTALVLAIIAILGMARDIIYTNRK